MKRTISLLVCFLIMVGTLITGTVIAAEEEYAAAFVYEKTEIDQSGNFTVSGELLYSGTVYGAVDYLAYARQGGAVVLKGNIKLSKGLTLQAVDDTTSYILIDGDVKLDLNGYSVTQQAGLGYSTNPAIIVPRNSGLELCDSSEAMRGTVNGVQYGIGINGGTLTLSGGTIKAQAQAGPAPDDVEVGVNITNGGTLSVEGGSILFDGELDDGRLYYGKSGSVLADSTGRVNITGGRIEGGIYAEEANLTVRGGTFGFDISHKLSPLYRAEQKNGLYTVKYCLPVLTGVDCGADLRIVSEDNNGKELFKQFEVKARATDPDLRSIKVDIRELLDLVTFANQDVAPEILVDAEFADVKIDSPTVKALAEEGYGENVWLEIRQEKILSEEIAAKMENAKYEVIFSITDEEGEPIKADAQANIVIHHQPESVVNGIQLYSVEGDDVKNKIHTLSGNDISSKTVNGERLMVTEGIVMIITGQTLNISGTISIVFYADLTGTNLSGVRMLFWDSPQTEYTAETAQRSVGYSSKDTYGYRFIYGDIAAKDMNKKIYARLCARDINGMLVYGSIPESGYSVANYAENMLENEKLRPLLAAMVNYGAAAQEYFGSAEQAVNMILPPQERVTDYTRVYESEAKTITEETRNGKCQSRIAGKTLMLEEDISINYYVSGEEWAEETGILFWTEDAYVANQSHIMGTQSQKLNTYTEDGGYRVYSYDGIAPDRMFDSVYARVYTKKDGIYRYGDIDKYSVKDYAANQIEKSGNPVLINLLRSLLAYGEATKAYYGE